MWLHQQQEDNRNVEVGQENHNMHSVKKKKKNFGKSNKAMRELWTFSGQQQWILRGVVPQHQILMSGFQNLQWNDKLNRNLGDSWAMKMSAPPLPPSPGYVVFSTSLTVLSSPPFRLSLSSSLRWITFIHFPLVTCHRFFVRLSGTLPAGL